MCLHVRAIQLSATLHNDMCICVLCAKVYLHCIYFGGFYNKSQALAHLCRFTTPEWMVYTITTCHP